jgi:RHS repeat-associated protein
VQINRYDEYGIPASSNSGRFQYTGQIWLAELGLYHYKARIYSPTLGRFLQTDPVGYQDQFNLYAYVGNDLVNGTDPTGLATITWNGPNAAVITFYYRMKENGQSFEFTPEALTEFIERSVQGTTILSDGREVSVTSRMVIVAPDDTTTGGSDTKTIFQDSAATHRPGIQSYADGPGGDIHLQPGESVFVAGHEVPHPAGAGDQRAGGVDADGRRIPDNAGPFPDTLMNNSAPHVNAQTLREMLECRCNVHTNRPQ